MANIYSVGRHVEAQVSIANTGGTVDSGVYFPVGAIITGLRVFTPGAVTVVGANATIVPRIGGVALAATVAISDMPGASTPAVTALGTTNGIYLGTSGAFNISCQASAGAAATATYNYYVDYIIVAT